MPNTADGVTMCGCERGDFHPGFETISSVYSDCPVNTGTEIAYRL